MANIKDLSVGDLAVFHCFDGSTIEVQITEIHDKIVYGKSSIGYHWANPKNVELISDTKHISKNN